jgi:hypothetical protein
MKALDLERLPRVRWWQVDSNRKHGANAYGSDDASHEIVASMIDCNESGDTVARTKSPLGTIEALLDENNGGATTSFGYVVGPRSVSLWRR